MVAVTKRRLQVAFNELQLVGYMALPEFWCCGTCAVAALPDDTKKYVFYHQQDAQAFVGGRLRRGMYLGWGGDGATIVEVLRSTGLRVTWDGDPATRILVEPQADPLPKEYLL